MVERMDKWREAGEERKREWTNKKEREMTGMINMNVEGTCVLPQAVSMDSLLGWE
jgi:hypothetical protein